MKLKTYVITAAILPLCSCMGCASKKQTAITGLDNIVIAAQPTSATAPQPKAIAYKMTGHATATNVPVQVNAQGDIVSFPDPADLKNAEPIQLKDGYLLDRRGVNSNTRFLRYTYAEYSALDTAPSISELKEAIISDARVSDIIRLPVTVSQAVGDIKAVNAMLP